jgi:transposase
VAPSSEGGGCKECERLRARIQVLETENRLLKERLTSLESSAARAGWYKPSLKPLEERKKPGRREGHVGAGRHKPDHVDEIIQLRIKKCPDCGTRLGNPYDARSRYIWDVPPPPLVKVTEYRIHRYWCSGCGRSVEAQPDTLPHFRLGIGVWNWAYVMHHQLNVSHDKIVWWMREVWNLPVTKSALTQGLNSLAERLKPVYDGMVLEARDSPYNHVDETGARVSGENWWTWVYRTPHQILYHTVPTRGSQEPKGFLGEDYWGVVVKDNYSAYNPLRCGKQADWVHLLRKARELTETENPHPEYGRLYHRLQRIYCDIRGYHLRYREKPPPEKERVKHYRRFEQRLSRLVNREYEDGGALQVVARIQNRFDEYLTCILHPEVPPHNNPAEQALRNRVLHRRNSATRSVKSAETHDILQSLLQTQLQQTSNPLEATHQILQQITT